MEGIEIMGNFIQSVVEVAKDTEVTNQGLYVFSGVVVIGIAAVSFLATRKI